jgi:hypothetical protein
LSASIERKVTAFEKAAQSDRAEDFDRAQSAVMDVLADLQKVRRVKASVERGYDASIERSDAAASARRKAAENPNGIEHAEEQLDEHQRTQKVFQELDQLSEEERFQLAAEMPPMDGEDRISSASNTPASHSGSEASDGRKGVAETAGGRNK